MSAITNRDAITWLEEVARYFEKLAVEQAINGEDRAYWANIHNSETSRKVADLIRNMQGKQND